MQLALLALTARVEAHHVVEPAGELGDAEHLGRPEAAHVVVPDWIDNKQIDE